MVVRMLPKTGGGRVCILLRINGEKKKGFEKIDEKHRRDDRQLCTPASIFEIRKRIAEWKK